jgi:Zn ribbon nucleic-acid-binding protein
MTLTQIKVLQRTCKAAFVVAMACFVLLGVQALLFSSSFVTVALTGALASFFAVLFLLGAIASAKCPSCKRLFVGSTVEDGVPTASLFTVDCMHCGFPTQCIPSAKETR